MALDLISGESRHEYMCVGIQAFGAPLGTAALEIADLLDACVKLGFPCLLGYGHVVAVENLVDRVRAAGSALAPPFA
jgi:hypothetical protein